MEVDRDTVVKIAGTIDSERAGSLADLLLDLLELEYASRHHKKPNLVTKFVDNIDQEQRP